MSLSSKDRATSTIPSQGSQIMVSGTEHNLRYSESLLWTIQLC
jgi:hypothetical protein